MSFKFCTCVLGLFRMLSVVLFCSMFFRLLTSFDCLRSSCSKLFEFDFCRQFWLDCFVLGCLDWSRLFTLFRLVLVLLVVLFDVQVFVYCFRFFAFVFICLKIVFGCVLGLFHFSICFSSVFWWDSFWLRLGYCWFA